MIIFHVYKRNLHDPRISLTQHMIRDQHEFDVPITQSSVTAFRTSTLDSSSGSRSCKSGQQQQKRYLNSLPLCWVFFLIIDPMMSKNASQIINAHVWLGFFFLRQFVFFYQGTIDVLSHFISLVNLNRME